ncbi:MAG TPA: SH3 domain-containing protein, partial [Myxococcales bacterium]
RGLVVRTDPGTAGQQIGSLPEGTRVEILAGPAPVGGQNWYQVSVANPPLQGWVISTALSPQR